MTKKDLLIIVGNTIKAYRLLRKMTQEELAERVGVSTSFCTNIEGGEKGISIYTLRDFADALGVTANDLLYVSSTDRRVDNIALLLWDRPNSFLSWIEKIVNFPVEDFQSGSA